MVGYIGLNDNIPENAENKYEWVGNNTGNLLFDRAIKNIIDAELITNINEISSDKYDAFITTAFIWLRYNDSLSENYHKKLFSVIKDKPLIPISVGLQSDKYDPDFKIYESTIDILSKMSERCVLGVRGNYTAEILNRYGIKNIKVIGCPSVFYHFDYNFSIKNVAAPKNCCVNFRAFYTGLKEHEKKFLVFCAENNFAFVEQNEYVLTESMCEKEVYLKIKNWIANNANSFFSIDNWIEYIRQFDFNMGYRFHGNIAALCAGVPSLFLIMDSRTTEMCEFLKVPALKAGMFDSSKPIEYYAEIADYTEFNKNFPDLLDNFLRFCNINKIPLKNNPKPL